MRIRTFLTLALTAGLAAACSDTPVEPAATGADLTAEALFARASGAQETPDLAAWDANNNDLVCVKTVPASGKASSHAGQRTIVKDDTDGSCPGGFTAETLVVDSDGDGIPDGEDACPFNPRC